MEMLEYAHIKEGYVRMQQIIVEPRGQLPRPGVASFLTDSRLSMAAKGFLAFLLQQESSFDFKINQYPVGICEDFVTLSHYLEELATCDYAIKTHQPTAHSAKYAVFAEPNAISIKATKLTNLQQHLKTKLEDYRSYQQALQGPDRHDPSFIKLCEKRLSKSRREIDALVEKIDEL